MTTERVGSTAAGAIRLQFYWLCCLLLSFAYELPLLELTSMDRVNPRLFDLAALFGFIFVLPTIKKRSHRLPRPFKTWRWLVFWFVFCAIIWSITFLPTDKAMYSLFYAFRYLQGLIVIYLALKIPISPEQKRVLHYVVVAGGIFIGLFCIPEYIFGSTRRYIAGGKEISLAPGTLLGPLGATYGHIAAWTSLAFAMTVSLVDARFTRQRRWIILGIALFVAWPGLVSGSRSGFFSIILIFALALVYLPKLRNRIMVGTAIAILFGGLLAVQLPSVDKMRGASHSIDRLLGAEEAVTRDTGEFSNSIMERLQIGEGNIQGYTLELYQWQGWLLPLIGGGFYVVPHTLSSSLHYRVGYGIHNGYLFPLEQGGVLAFVLFIAFLVICFKQLRIMKCSMIHQDASFAMGMWLYFVILLLRNWVGSPFWLSVGSENFGTFLVLLIILACKPTGPWKSLQPKLK